jgi:hypothetical protein
MSFETGEILRRFHKALVTEIRKANPGYLNGPFTVAEIYQNLVPYRTHRDEIGVEMNGDYEDALLRLLAGEGDFLVIESNDARQTIREELAASNPNTGIFRDFAAADVRLNPQMLGLVDDSVPEDAAGEPVSEPEEVYETFEEVFEVEEPEVVAQADDTPMEGLSFGAIDQPAVTEEPVAESAPFGAETQEHADLSDTGQADLPDAGVVEEVEEDASEPPGTCPWCRESLPSSGSLNFCPFCGSSLKVVPCSECGEELELNWRFCVSCGTEVKK